MLSMNIPATLADAGGVERRPAMSSTRTNTGGNISGWYIGAVRGRGCQTGEGA